MGRKQVVAEYLRLYPSESTRGIARRLIADRPDLFSNFDSARDSVRSARGKQSIEIPVQTPAITEGIKSDFTKDAGEITITSRNVHNLEDAIKLADVDLAIWEVERYVINTWEMGRKDKTVDIDLEKETPKKGSSVGHIKVNDTGKVFVQPLVQVKVWLKKKDDRQRSLEDLLKAIEEKAPIIRLKPVPKSETPHRRSLELDIMDAHVGLLCQQPEADAPWDLDLAASHILAAIDDLLAKVAPHGPFEEVFMPFGNDFTHSDNVFHTTTAGTPQPESIDWHRVFGAAEALSIEMTERVRKAAPAVHIYEVPGNHSRVTDFCLARLLKAFYRTEPSVHVDASTSPYKFHRFGVNLIGFEHGHSIKPIRMSGLLANERRHDWAEVEYKEWHLGDQHRKGSADFEEQGVSIEHVPGIVAPNSWHRIKSYNHQKRGAFAYVYDFYTGPIARFQHNISQYHHKPLSKENNPIK